jgi:hypothetical protein
MCDTLSLHDALPIWRGSSNQRVKFLTVLGKKQQDMPVVYKEFIISPGGNTLETGFHV